MTDSAVVGLPKFKYHPDPVATGVFVASELECIACGLARGWIYTGAIYCKEELDERICPWCIHDGKAHSKFDADFFDSAAVGDYGAWSSAPQSVVEEICFRTPSFNGWQQQRWFTHCNDAALFVGYAGQTELKELYPAAIEAIRLESGYDEEQWAYYFEQMNADHGPTAYLFRCLHCGAWGGYSDCD